MMVVLPCSAAKAKFLGSRYKIGVAGTVASQTSDVRLLTHDGDDERDVLGYSTAGSMRLPGTCTAMELCT